MVEPIAVQQGLKFSASSPASQIIILGDHAALKRLVWILVDNALKYSTPAGEIDLSLSMHSGHATISVRDNGIGISSTDLPRIFDRFYRADPSRGMVEGNGLGLAIAKWIADTHQAQLSVASEVGQGTSFSLSFPHAQHPASTEATRSTNSMPVLAS